MSKDDEIKELKEKVSKLENILLFTLDVLSRMQYYNASNDRYEYINETEDFSGLYCELSDEYIWNAKTRKWELRKNVLV